jgi:hypothetical protein
MPNQEYYYNCIVSLELKFHYQVYKKSVKS